MASMGRDMSQAPIAIHSPHARPASDRLKARRAAETGGHVGTHRDSVRAMAVWICRMA